MATKNKDRYLDLLFFHRGMRRLVAIELKMGDFEPEHKGKQMANKLTDADIELLKEAHATSNPLALSNKGWAEKPSESAWR